VGNLLTNALRFTPQGGRVSVRAERRRGETWFSVSDTGPGIAANRLEAIFERYEQGAVADRKGLGLGLYIAKRIVEAHGGRIWAESSGGGSTFKFTLPDRPRT
jgi:signal transduction histidine kinase